MKKIAFVVRLFQTGDFYAGGEKFIYKTIGEFVKNGYIVDVWCDETDSTKATGINEIILYKKPDATQESVVVENEYNELKQKNYDFVITDGVALNADIMLLQVYSRKFNSKNLFEKIYYNFKPNKIKHFLFEQKCFNQKHKKIFVVSNSLKYDLLKKFKIAESEISVVYPGVDMPDAIITKNNNNLFTFGISATFFKRKGGLLFLLALIVTKLRGYDFGAVMILRNTSKKRWLNKILKFFNMEKNVEFLPFQNKMTDFYSKIDCLVMPSFEEAFGLVALEGMINKIPTIISSCSGISEIIVDKNNGFVFDLNYKAALNLAEKMIYLFNNPHITENCVENACQTAQKYSWERTFKKIEEELSQLSSNEDKESRI